MNGSEQDAVKNILRDTLKSAFAEVLESSLKDLRTRQDEIMREINKIGELEKRLVELENLIIINRLNLN